MIRWKLRRAQMGDSAGPPEGSRASGAFKRGGGRDTSKLPTVAKAISFGRSPNPPSRVERGQGNQLDNRALNIGARLGWPLAPGRSQGHRLAPVVGSWEVSVAGLKLPMLERPSVRLTVCVPPDLKRALHDYGAVYPSEYGRQPLGELNRHFQCVRHEHRTA